LHSPKAEFPRQFALSQVRLTACSKAEAAEDDGKRLAHELLHA